MLELLTTVFYDPLHNALIFLTSVVPGGDVGIAVIILTVAVKLILFPLSKRSIHSQAKLRELEPEMKKIKEKYKNKEEQARKTFELYKVHKINPFSGCLLILIQLPVIIALYYVFFKGLSFAEGTLYSFVQIPETLNMNFLGLVNMQEKSLILAILAGVSQFIQARLMMPKSKENSVGSGKGDFQENLKKSMQFQMRYILPVFIAVIAYQISSAVALYWVTSNTFQIGQEIFMKRKMKRDANLLTSSKTSPGGQTTSESTNIDKST